MSSRRALGLFFKRAIAEHITPKHSYVRGLCHTPTLGVETLTSLEGSREQRRRKLLPKTHGPAAIPFVHTHYISTSSQPLSAANERDKEAGSTGVSRREEPFDTVTDRIPERPVSVVEGASYSIVIFAGLAAAGAAVYAVVNELLLEPKEYKVFNKALERVRNESQVTVRTGVPLKGYGHESRNRAARQRISHRVWKDERGTEHIEVQFHIRGPEGSGVVRAEMFHDSDRQWKFTYLVVDITSPVPTSLLLESYMPAPA